MKKKTVSKDPLAEKIEEILAPYPNPMSRNDFRIVCHIGTRTSLYLLQSGLVPCKNNGKKTVPRKLRPDEPIPGKQRRTGTLHGSISSRTPPWKGNRPYKNLEQGAEGP